MDAARKALRELAERLRSLWRPWAQRAAGRPLVSLGLGAALCLALLVVQVGFAGRLDAAGREITAAVDFAIHHPAVEIAPRLGAAVQARLPGFEGNETFSFLRNAQGQRDAAAQQQELDALTAAALERVDSHPRRRLGLVPARLGGLGIAAHPLVHAGWIHGLATLALLLLLGPLLEAAWGRRLTAGLIGLATALGAGVFVALHRGGEAPLLGAGAAVSALAGAGLVCFWGRSVDPLAWLPGDASLPLPFWSLAPLWLAYEGLVFWSGGGGLPAGFEAAASWPADLAGAWVGGLAALGLRRVGVEERLETVVAPEGPARRSRPFDFERVRGLRARGQVDRAYALLEAEVARSARNRDAVVTFFEMSVERGAPEAGVPAMRRLIAEELRRGAAPVAVGHWRTISEHVEDPRIEPALLARLIPLIRQEDGDEVARVALRQATALGVERLGPSLACEIAELSADLDPRLAAEAARRALEAEGLHADARRRLRSLADAGGEEDPGSEAPKPVELPVNVFYEEQDRSAFGSADDELTTPGAEQGLQLEMETEPAAPPVPAGPLQVTEAVPLELAGQALWVQVAERGRVGIGFDQIHAVASVGVRDLGPRPVIVIDLVVSGSDPSGYPRRVVRMRSDAFDPRPFAPDAESPLAALRSFVVELAFLAGADVLVPADDSPLQVFDGVEAYERQVLQPALGGAASV